MVEWPRGEATACKAVYTGSNPVSTSTAGRPLHGAPLPCQTGRMADESAPTSDDQRDKFKAALDAKKAKGGHAGSAHGEAGGKAKGHSTREGGKREFRRKSGG